MLPKLITLDIDGTILGTNDTLSPRLISILARAQKAGTRIALATGRPYFATQHIISALQIDAPSMFHSGSYILDVQSGEEFVADYLDEYFLERFLALASEKEWYTELYDKTDYFVEGSHPFLDIHLKYLKKDPHIIDFSNAHKSRYLKGVYILPAEEAPEAADLVNDILSDATVAISYAAGDMQIAFFNISSRNASREKAFDVMTEILNIRSEDVISFGDAESDIPFLKKAGTGVAMSNAPESVRTAADVTTLSVDEDGVAEFLEKIF